MLSPGTRTLLVEALRPPQGYHLDRALGTTFSLDLLALLTTPLAFTFYAWEEEGGTPSDALQLLKALRRNAERITVFCQAGQISVPRKSRVLYSYLEGSVVEVSSPSPEGSFHPKVWTLRFEAPDGNVRYRVLVLSRNLTFDQSWDTILVLDGTLVDRTNAYARNHPLGDFIKALPDLAVRDLPGGLRGVVDRMQHEVRRVDFEHPAGFTELEFWPLGIPGARGWPFVGRRDRMLVVSPFLSNGFLRRIVDGGDGHLLLSRVEELDRLEPPVFDRFDSVYALSPAADVEDRDPEDGASEDFPEVPRRGLHAKLFVADAGWDARIWTGSANATSAAFDSNVEFLVELRGRKSVCGIDEVLGGPQNTARLLDLLEPVSLPETSSGEQSVEERLGERLRRIRRALGATEFVAVVRKVDDGSFHIVLEAREKAGLDLPLDIDVRCWPITLSESAARALEGGLSGTVADFGASSYEAITSFFAFQLVVGDPEEDVEIRCRFVLNLPLEGAPTDRKERALEAILGDPREVLRFLLLLLEGEGLDDEAFYGPGMGASILDRGGRGEVPLLETLLRVLDRNPDKLDEIEAFLADLRSSERGRALLPEGIDRIWAPIWEVRREAGP